MWISLEADLFREAVISGQKDVAIHMVLEAMAKTAPGPNDKAYRDAVAVSEGELEVDDDAVVSLSDDDGAYVQTWTWISDVEAGLVKNCPYCADELEYRAKNCWCGYIFPVEDS